MTTQAETLVERYRELLNQKTIEVSIDPRKPADQSLVLTVVLKDKTVSDYFQIVAELFTAYDQETEAANKHFLQSLYLRVMAIGTDTLGIDWS